MPIDRLACKGVDAFRIGVYSLSTSEALQLWARPDVYIADQMAENAVQSLSIEASHAFQVFHLPPHHRDPFDRMLIAQAQLENIPIITSDPMFPSTG